MMPSPDRIWLQDGGDAAACQDPAHITWCADPVHEDDTAYVRAAIHIRVVALLREALEELRAEAQAMILVEAQLERRNDTLVPRLDTVDPAACEAIEPLLDLLRRVERVTGRSPGGTAWMDDLLDGRVTVRAGGEPPDDPASARGSDAARGSHRPCSPSSPMGLRSDA